MKKKKETEALLRLNTIIESDRLCVSSGFEKLVVSDLNRLFSDFFDIKGDVKLEVVKNGKNYSVYASATATRIKPFGVIPK